MTWHRHLGAYGICMKEAKLLVVNKTSGPYRNRYDLPGGTIEPQETIAQAIIREFHEEVGIQVELIKQAGIGEYVVHAPLREHSHTQHIALLFEVQCEESVDFKVERISDDARGGEWVSLAELTEDNASPLVLTAKLFLLKDPTAFASRLLDDWVINPPAPS